MSKFVKFVGVRIPRMRVHVVVNGNQFRPGGYPAGRGTVLEVNEAEADVLTGVTQPAINENGRIVTGFYVDGDLGEAGLTGEKWIEVADLLGEPIGPAHEPEIKPVKKSKATVTEPVAASNEQTS